MAPEGKRSYNNADLTAVEVGALKKKATVARTLQIRIAVKHFDLPVEVHVLKGDPEGRYVFISIPAVNALLGSRSDGGYEVVNPSERDAAVRALKAVRPRSATKVRTKGVEMPTELAQAIKTLVPKGYRVQPTAEGSYRLVKARPRRRAT